MNKRIKMPAVLLTAAMFLSGCSVLSGDNREFNNEIVGAGEIIQDVFGDEKKTKNCESYSKSENLSCKKQVDELVKSINKAKKSNRDE